MVYLDGGGVVYGGSSVQYGGGCQLMMGYGLVKPIEEELFSS